MDITDTRVLILGGSGLVGTAVARELLPHRPTALVISALSEAEALGAVAELAGEAGSAGTELHADWGDVFVADALRGRRRGELLADPAARSRLLADLYDPLDEELLEASALGRLLLQQRPDVVVDCINTSTVFAYQDVYAGAARALESAREGAVAGEQVERLLATLYLPQLIRHVQILAEGMRRAGTRSYVKVGTAGTGGMGLNIPFTHSEERPSRALLAKASLAGAQTLLLFLMARTPAGPAVKEVKPTAAISWKRIAAGEVLRGGAPIPRSDAVEAVPLAAAFSADASGIWRDTGETLTGVWVDAGENGLFSPGEFEALTALGLMEFITPEEIARDVVREITGHPTGHDVVGALDAATSGPTYRAGVLRQTALARLDELQEELGIDSVAYEMLGPPRLSKLLFEASILRRLSGGTLAGAAALEPDEAAENARDLVESDADLRTRILSIGLAILLPDGERLLRGRDVKVAYEPGADPGRLADRGWVDLRPANFARWRERVLRIAEEIRSRGGAEGGSRWDAEPWHHAGTLRPGALAAWIFRHEDAGERVKR